MAKRPKIKVTDSVAESTKSVEIYEHKGSKRLNNPQVGLVNTKTEKPENKKTYSFDPHLDPSLIWTGKAEKNALDLRTLSLHVHERIDPRTIIEAVKKSPEKIWEQYNLFNKPHNKLSFVKEIEFYKHEKDWSNRLIAGDSLLVMNSLLQRENCAEKVQTVFFDPPYGITYGSNFQPYVNKLTVKDGNDQDLNQEPEVLRAFRDTWELGIHSYLSHMRDRLLLIRELLKTTGSVFVQISDENLFRVQAVMDEIFGSQNFVAIIPFRKKTMPFGSKHLEQMSDFIIWYSKDKSNMKYRRLYRPLDVEGDQDHVWYEMPDGSRHRMTKEQNRNHALLPEGARVYRLKSLEPSGVMQSGMYQYEFEGVTYGHPKNGYATTKEGMDRLKARRRIQPKGNLLNYIMYADQSTFTAITAPWNDTVGADDKMYVVQTNTKVVERCILMTSDPGDLVFDPTCGSGTTAVVSEEWGRRWITCDTSRIAVQLAKQRLMTSSFEYFVLSQEQEGISSGFNYKKFLKETVGSIANNELPSHHDLYDQPEVDKNKARVCGPFTVEAVPAPSVTSIEKTEESHSYNSQSDSWISELRSTGIRLKNNSHLSFTRLESMPGTKWIHAEGTTDEKKPQRVVISFGPAHAPLEQKQVENVLQEAEKIKPSPTIIIFAAFQFDPEAAKDIDEIEWGGVSVLKTQMNADLFSDDLKKKKSSNDSFWLIGQPEIKLDNLRNGKFQVTVKGFDYYNPRTGALESGGQKQIAMWMLDTDYDGRSLLPRQIFFPLDGKTDGWSKLAKTLKNEIDEELILAYQGVESLPFEIGSHKKIAVKIVDDRGIESLIVRDLEV